MKKLLAASGWLLAVSSWLLAGTGLPGDEGIAVIAVIPVIAVIGNPIMYSSLKTSNLAISG